jgi:hypothetical protein
MSTTGEGPAAWRSANQATLAPISAPTTTRVTAGRAPFHLAAVDADVPSGGAVRSTPLRVRSKAQASPAVTGKPMARIATTAWSVQSGNRSACWTGSTTWSTANENRPHPSIARMTRRRLSS